MGENMQSNELDFVRIIFYIFKTLNRKKYFLLLFFFIGIMFNVYKHYFPNKKYQYSVLLSSRSNDDLNLLLINTQQIQSNISSQQLKSIPFVNREVLNNISSVNIDTVKKNVVELKIVGNSPTDINVFKRSYLTFIKNKNMNNLKYFIEKKSAINRDLFKMINKIDTLNYFSKLESLNSTQNVFLDLDFVSLIEKRISLYESFLSNNQEIFLLEKYGLVNELPYSSNLILKKDNSVLYPFLFVFIASIIIFFQEFILFFKKNYGFVTKN